MHMDTAPVARDIIEIFERHGEWREKEADRLLRGTETSPNEVSETTARTMYRPGEEMVQYWGFVGVYDNMLRSLLTFHHSHTARSWEQL